MTFCNHPNSSVHYCTDIGIDGAEKRYLRLEWKSYHYFHLRSTRLNNLMEKQQRNRKSRRCVLHTLEIQRLPPIWNSWREVWDCMELPCRQELTLIETDTLDEALDTYLRKHRYVASYKLFRNSSII